MKKQDNSAPTNAELIVFGVCFTAFCGLCWLGAKLQSWLIFCVICIITTALTAALLIPTKRVIKYITIIYDGDKPVEVTEIEREVK